MSLGADLSTISGALAVLGATNLAAFLLFAFDKHQARQQGRRTPERQLLLFAVLGGVGAWLGHRLLRHKTRKTPFRALLGFALAAHLIGVATVVWWLSRAAP